MVDEPKQEFWRWAESNWKNPDIDWKAAKYITVGIDVGSVSSQSVIMADGQIFAYANMRTGSDSPDSWCQFHLREQSSNRFGCRRPGY
jgi:activator of 2-hydroxyglutaryl-CoA dehydratase